MTAETIEVTIRDQSGEAPWGSGGLFTPCIRKVTISAFCPQCGQRRGERRGANMCEDGAYFWVEQWDNPCGHVDYYPEVVKEAKRLVEQRQDAVLAQLKPGDEVRVKFRFQFRDYDLWGRVLETNPDKREVNCVNVDDPADQGWLPIGYVVETRSGS